MTTVVLEARDLWKSYRGGDGSLLPVLSGVDLRVAQGEMVAIVGRERRGQEHAAARPGRARPSQPRATW